MATETATAIDGDGDCGEGGDSNGKDLRSWLGRWQQRQRQLLQWMMMAKVAKAMIAISKKIPTNDVPWR